MPFHRVKTKNNWEYITYSTRACRHLDERKDGRCDVKWPDGSETPDHPFISIQAYSSYSDHGNHSDVTQNLLVLPVTVRGVQLHVPINDVEIANVKQGTS